MASAAYFVAGILLIGLVIISVLLINSNQNITGSASTKITCSGGMAITDGRGNYCYMSAGSCGSACQSCDISVKVVDPETFMKRCSAGR